MSRLRRLVLLLAVIVAFTHLLSAQRASANYEKTFQNARIHVFRLSLSPHASTPVYLANHDQVWIALADLDMTLRSDTQVSQQSHLKAGDARFVARGTVQAISLNSSNAATLIVIILNPMPADKDQLSCDCTGEVAQTVCGCGKSSDLPSLWAVAIGNITLAASTLRPAQSYPEAVGRDDMLLIAITPVLLRDLVGSSSKDRGAELKLAAGESAWIPAGLHRFQNVAPSPAHFVTLEF